MGTTRVTLITTVLNEEKGVKDLIQSVYSQKRKPDEFIVVDGGSVDKTVSLIEENIQPGIPVKIFREKGSNISQGRNLAIKNSTNDIIAVTDSGCRLPPQWLENLMVPFDNDPDVDVVSGWYKPEPRTLFEEVVGEYSCPKLEEINPDKFLPSARSIAFKKDAWLKVGGFPEWLNTAEDTFFDLKLRETGNQFFFSEKAYVYWRPRGTFKEFYKQNFVYGKGDAQAGLFYKRFIKGGIRYAILLLMFGLSFIHYSFMFLTVFFIVTYSFLRSKKRLNKNSPKIGYFYFPILYLIQDIAWLHGYSQGLGIRGKRHR